jgi:hypothetical protein
MFKKITITTSIIFSIFFVFSLASPVMAQSESIIDNTSSNYEEGDYTVNDIVGIITNTSQIILGVIGSVTLLMFVYGGIMFLISGGSSEKVTKAKGILVAAVIGLIIVFSSYLIIKFVLGAIGRDDFTGEKMKINQNTIMTERIKTT